MEAALSAQTYNNWIECICTIFVPTDFFEILYFSKKLDIKNFKLKTKLKTRMIKPLMEEETRRGVERISTPRPS